jgi:hypothetical protein
VLQVERDRRVRPAEPINRFYVHARSWYLMELRDWRAARRNGSAGGALSIRKKLQKELVGLRRLYRGAPGETVVLTAMEPVVLEAPRRKGNTLYDPNNPEHVTIYEADKNQSAKLWKASPQRATPSLPAKAKAPRRASKPKPPKVRKAKADAMVARVRAQHLLFRPGGSTVREVMDAVDWQAETVASFVSKLAKQGIVFRASGNGLDRRYEIIR